MDGLDETLWLIWVGGGITALLLELLSLDFALTMLAGGAFAAAGTAALGFGFPAQAVVFAIVSTVGLALVRPRLKRWAHRSTPMTLTEVTTHGGQVKLAGEVWTARAAPGSLPLEPHSIAHVVAIDGATAVVEYRPAHAGEIPGGEGE